MEFVSPGDGEDGDQNDVGFVEMNHIFNAGRFVLGKKFNVGQPHIKVYITLRQ